MGFVKTATNVSHVKNLEDLMRWTSMALGDIVEQINGKIAFQNLQKQVIEVQFATANVEQAIGHNLGYVPNGYYQIGASVAAQVYNTTQNTSTFLYLKSSAAGTVKLYVF